MPLETWNANETKSRVRRTSFDRISYSNKIEKKEELFVAIVFLARITFCNAHPPNFIIKFIPLRYEKVSNVAKLTELKHDIKMSVLSAFINDSK